MVTKIEIDGFKTFRNFIMEFAPVTVIAGVNASGKSNLFDALKLLSDMAEKELSIAFSCQRGEANELFTQFGENDISEEIYFCIEMLLDKKIKDKWGGEAILKYTRLKYELTIKRMSDKYGRDHLVVVKEVLNPIRHEEDTWIKKYINKENFEQWRPKVVTGKRGYPYIETISNHSIVLRQDGTGGNKKEYPINNLTQTVLSGINSVDFRHVFAVKEEMRNWKFLQLDPQALREPTRQVIGMSDIITKNGENLAAALFRINNTNEYNRKEISRKISNLLPQFTEIYVIDDKENKQYILKLKNQDGRFFTSRVLSEGTLRLIALCILQYDEKFTGLLCFEEPENGVHPARIKNIARLIIDLSVDFAQNHSPLRQVIMNTHSPVLIKELMELSFEKSNCNTIAIWFSRLVNSIIERKGNKLKIQASNILPVEPDNIQDKKGNLYFNFSDQQRKLVLRELKNYLETADTEQIIKGITDA